MSIIPLGLNSYRFTHLWETARKDRGLYVRVEDDSGIDFFYPAEFCHGSELIPKVLFEPIPEDPNRFSVRLSGDVSLRFFCEEVRAQKPDHWIRLIQIDCHRTNLFVSYNQSNKARSGPIKILVPASEVWS